MTEIYHYCKFEDMVSIINSGCLWLKRYVKLQARDELVEGLRLCREILTEGSQTRILQLIEYAIDTHAFYLVSFTNNPASKNHVDRYGECILCFDKDSLGDTIFLNGGVLNKDDCWFECSYDEEKNRDEIVKLIKKIADVKDRSLQISEIIDFVKTVLPVLKNTGSKVDAEYRIFVDSSEVQNDPVYKYDGNNQRRQSMPKVTVCSCNAYIELSYGDGLKRILLPEKYFNALERLKSNDIPVEKYVLDLADERT